MLVVAFAKTAEIGRAIMADRFQCEFGDPLLDFRTLDLEQARFRPRTTPGSFTGQTAQFGEFECGQIGLQFGHLALEEGVGEQRTVAILLRNGRYP